MAQLTRKKWNEAVTAISRAFRFTHGEETAKLIAATDSANAFARLRRIMQSRDGNPGAISHGKIWN